MAEEFSPVDDKVIKWAISSSSHFTERNSDGKVFVEATIDALDRKVQCLSLMCSSKFQRQLRGLTLNLDNSGDASDNIKAILQILQQE